MGKTLADGYIEIRPDTSKLMPQLRRDLAGSAALERAGADAGEAVGDGMTRTLTQSARDAIRGVQAQMERLSRTSAEPKVQLDAATSLARLAKLEQQLDKLDGRNVTVDVDADVDRASRSLERVSRLIHERIGDSAGRVFDRFAGAATAAFDAAGQAAAKFGLNTASSLGSAAVAGTTMTASTGGLNIVLGALATALLAAAAGAAALTTGFVALAPALLAAGGLIGAVTTAVVGAGAAAAVFKLGLGGVSDAMSALDSAQQDTGKSGKSLASTQNAVASAVDGVRSALQSQANTRRQVAEAARRSAQQVTDAEGALTRAQREALDITRELDGAREAARRRLAGMAGDVKAHALAERQANLDIARAREELQKTLNDRKASDLDKQQAQLAYEREVLQLEDLRRRGKELAADQAKAAKAGVNGSTEVLAVRERIAAANERTKQAEKALAEARRQQALQQVQGQQQIAQAAAQVASAQRAVRQASVSAGTSGSAAMDKLGEAMAKLSPNARTLVRTLDDLEGPFNRLKRRVQDRLLDGVAGQIRTLAGRWLPTLDRMLGRLADRFNNVGDKVFAALGRKDFMANIEEASNGFGNMIDRIGKSIPGVIDAFGRLAGSSTPVLERIGDIIGRILDRFSKWIKVSDQSGDLDQFMEDAADALDRIFTIGGKVIGIIGQIFKIFFPESKKTSDGFLATTEKQLTKVEEWLKDPENQQKVRDWVAAIKGFAAGLASAGMAAGRMANAVDKTKTRVSGAWTGLKNAAFGPLRNWATVLLPAAATTLRDAWSKRIDSMRASASGAWASIRDRTLNPMRSWVTTTLPAAFRAGVTAVKGWWDRLKDYARKPVAFVVNTVIGKGILGTMKTVAGWLKMDNLVESIPKVKFAAGGHYSGRLPGRPSAVDNTLGMGPGGQPVALAGGEYIVNARQTQRYLPLLEAVNRGALPGYANGGLLSLLAGPAKWLRSKVGDPVKQVTQRYGKGPIAQMAGAVGGKVLNAAIDKVGSLVGFGGGGNAGPDVTGAGPIGGGWPPGPWAQRGDSGVWRSMLAMVKSTGIPYSFGNSYRPGDPLWHGSGRAIDFMGYNQDRLASFFMSMKSRILELIHTTATRGYYISRGRVVPRSFMGEQAELHRNHIHVAMSRGGRIPVFDAGGVLAPGVNVVDNRTGGPEALVRPDQAARHYTINVNVPAAANPVEVGRRVVEAIQAFERANGRRWRAA